MNYIIGTSANNIVQLNSSAKLPAIDGSLLTNLPPGGISNVSEDTSPTLGGNLEMTKKYAYGEEYTNTASTSSVSVDWETNGPCQRISYSYWMGSTTVSFSSNPPGPCNIKLKCYKNTTYSSATLNFSGITAIKTPGDSAITTTTSSVSGTTDILEFYWDGATYWLTNFVPDVK